MDLLNNTARLKSSHAKEKKSAPACTSRTIDRKRHHDARVPWLLYSKLVTSHPGAGETSMMHVLHSVNINSESNQIVLPEQDTAVSIVEKQTAILAAESSISALRLLSSLATTYAVDVG